MTVLELTTLVGTMPQDVSKHLNLLQRAGIVGRFETLRHISGAGA